MWLDALVKGGKAVTRKSRYYDTEAGTAMTDNLCKELKIHVCMHVP